MRLDVAEIGVRHAPRRVCAHRFEYVLDGDVVSCESAWGN
jgi:hypothetical protein